jgi:hypothetical protein
MGELVERLGNKAAGQLIKSEDWNDLVGTIEDLSEMVNDQFQELDNKIDEQIQGLSDKVDGQIQELTDRVSTLTGDFGDFRESVEPLLGEYYRLTMKTTRTNYAIGELAEITAEVTDLRGNPLDLTNEADRPWIDFVVASWGQLKPVAGFESLGGTGDRTISVRTDAQGIARVYLRSDHAEGFTNEDEIEVAVSLETRLPRTDKSIVETILAAATPMEAKEKGAFEILTAEYDRTDALRVRNYTDAYYSKNTALVADRVRPIFRHRWRDFRATVMAFARRDSDPVTPDQSRGVSSIQVTFRDWIEPWIILDYFVETDVLVEDFRDRLVPKITNDLEKSVDGIKDEVNEFVFDRGLIGKQRNYRVIRKALDEVVITQPLDFPLNDLTEPMRDAIGVQQSLESAQGAPIDFAGREVAFGAFTEAALRADTSTAKVKEEFTSLLQQEVGQVEQALQEEVSQVEQTLQARVRQEQQSFKDSLLAENGPIRSVEKTVTTFEGRVNTLQGLNVTEVTDRLALVKGLENRLARLEQFGSLEVEGQTPPIRPDFPQPEA